MKMCDPVWWTNVDGQKYQAEIMKSDQDMIYIRVWMQHGIVQTRRVSLSEITPRQTGRLFP